MGYVLGIAKSQRWLSTNMNMKDLGKIVQFSCSVVSNSLEPHGLKHTGLPVHHQLPESSNACPLSWWCHPTISSSIAPFSSLLQSFPASGSFQMSQFFASSGQSIEVSASASVLPMNIQDWSPLGWTGWISLQSKGLSRVFSNHSSKASILRCSAFFIVQISNPYTTTGKTIALTRWTFVGKIISLLFNTLSRLVLAFLRRKRYGIWSHHFMANRWGNSGNNGWLYSLGLQNHCRWLLLPWN